MFYFSYEDLPELSKFSPDEKRVVWINFTFKRSEHSARLSLVYGVVIVVGLVIGLAVGVILKANSLVLAAGGAVLSAGLIRIFHVALSRSALRRYLDSKDFSLAPINRRAEAKINGNGSGLP